MLIGNASNYVSQVRRDVIRKLESTNKGLASVLKSICKKHQPEEDMLHVFRSQDQKALNKHAQTLHSFNKVTSNISQPQSTSHSSLKEKNFFLRQPGPRSWPPVGQNLQTIPTNNPTSNTIVVHVTSEFSTEHQQRSNSSGMEAENFQGKLEDYHLDFSAYIGLLSSKFFKKATSSLLISDAPIIGQSTEHHGRGGTESRRETSYLSGPYKIPVSRVLQQHLCCSQKKGVASLKSQSVFGGSQFLNPESEGCHSCRGLSCSERHLPVSSNGCPVLSLSSLPLEGGHIQIHKPPFSV